MYVVFQLFANIAVSIIRFNVWRGDQKPFMDPALDGEWEMV
jgi:hypothetical protein